MQFLFASDFDGTLFYTEKAVAAAYHHALTDFGFSMPLSYYRKKCDGRSYKEFLPPIIGTNDSKLLHAIHEKKKKYYRQYYSLIEPNTALLKNLYMVHESPYINSYTAIVTTAAKESVLEILDYFSCDSIFDFIIGAEDVTKPKPDPECYLSAIKTAGVQPCNTVIYEDSDNGIQAALASGANVIRVLRMPEKARER